MNQTILVTGGAGFIGSALVRHLIQKTGHRVVNVDKLTYAASTESLASVANSDRYTFAQVDICDGPGLAALFSTHKITAVMHLAAESHVDRSISGPGAFVQTNMVGTYTLLEETRRHFANLSDIAKQDFRFLHVSTDEVFGTLGDTGYFTEDTPYQPNSPYSASKAGSDHLVRAWHHTFGLPTLMTNCSNNYGPFQAPEKLIPVVILSALKGKPIPVYGEGKNVRDWLFVDDHVSALCTVLEKGKIGESYNVGCHNDVTNLVVIRAICKFLDELVKNPVVPKHESLIQYVQDRAGHDFRYAIDASRIEKELGWKPAATFEQHLRKTVQWYLDNLDWCDKALQRIQHG